ncbi:MAG: hypothetical protein QOG00_3896 [Pyrinomonadaceae bacterium]|nr:hypothetical protein [Pyrinomonadaceae bacterium]MDQ1613965.1 hypothetical protein [Pyrinomonadaceae bacterium]
MKKLQRIFASASLTFLLSISVFAGDGIIHTGKTEPSPTTPPVTATNNEAEAEGIIHTGRTTSGDPVTEIVLGLLPSVLALF